MGSVRRVSESPCAKSAGYGATAPKQGNCRGRASRVRAVYTATMKRASCGVSPVARPSAAPADWKTASGGLGTIRKSWRLVVDPGFDLHLWICPEVGQQPQAAAGNAQAVENLIFPVFPCCEAAFPIRRGEGEGLARSRGGGRNAVSDRRYRTSQDAHAHPPPVS